MTRRVVAIGVLLGGLGFTAVAGAEELFQARPTGDQEVPAVETDTTGRFKILVNKDATGGVQRDDQRRQGHQPCGW